MVRAKAMASVMSRYIIDQKSRDDIDMRLLLFSSLIRGCKLNCVTIK
jgi:hypothetical protein